jgi:pyridoxal phosphate enzyme (YggS family)
MVNFENYYLLKEELADNNVKLIAVSKNQSAENIQILYNKDHRDFGENKAQELVSKYKELPVDINWHFIGHLQSNKIKSIIPFVTLIHSVDSFKLLVEINKEAAKAGRVADCLLQVYIAREESKFGLDQEELKEILNSDKFHELQNIRITGLMGMATFTDNQIIVRQEFRFLYNLFSKIKSEYFRDQLFFKDLSMGMSDDYKIAIEEGSTMIRVGTYIFGQRKYS